MRVLITGASKGLGAHLVQQFLSRGDSVWGIGRSTLDIDDNTYSNANNFTYRRCEITNRDEVNRVYQEMIQHGFVPDIVILCAGAAVDDVDSGMFSLEKMKRNFDINVYGAMVWLELFLPRFVERKRGIFAAISSMSIYRENHAHRIGYSASKAALNKVFENLSQEYYGAGVSFVIFNMGKMQERVGFIGTSYSNAASSISRILLSKRIPRNVNIPFSQYILTKILQRIPMRLFCTSIRK